MTPLASACDVARQRARGPYFKACCAGLDLLEPSLSALSTNPTLFSTSSRRSLRHRPLYSLRYPPELHLRCLSRVQSNLLSSYGINSRIQSFLPPSPLFASDDHTTSVCKRPTTATVTREAGGGKRKGKSYDLSSSTLTRDRSTSPVSSASSRLLLLH
jgi:hypothetical protein